MDDWLLYVLHDIGYLSSKGQKRNVHYKIEDMKATDYDALNFLYNNIDRSKFERLQWLVEAAGKHIPFWVLVQEGKVPVQQRSVYEHQYADIVAANEKHLKFQNGGRKRSHEKTDSDG